MPFPPARESPTYSRSPEFPNSVNNGASSSANIAPVRHPRPLTAAELHLELEKEQEAVVNRLTRELATLQAHNSASNSLLPSGDVSVAESINPNGANVQPAEGPTHPVSTLRDRSASNVNARGVRSRSSTAQSQVATSVLPLVTPVEARRAATRSTSQASLDRSRDIASSRRSGQNSSATGSPIASSIAPNHMPPTLRTERTPSPHTLFRRRCDSASSEQDRNQLMHQQTSQRGSFSVPSPVLLTSNASRFEEATQARAALESTRRENEALVARLKEVEHELKRREKASDS